MKLEDLFCQTFFTKGIPDCLAFGSGVGLGVSHSTHTNLPGFVDSCLKFGPTALQAAVGGYLGLCLGIADNDYDESYTPKIIKRGALGAVIGAAETALGYCIGYTIGSLTR